MKTPQKWHGKLKVSSRARRKKDYKELIVLKAEFIKFLRENNMRFMTHGTYPDEKFVLCFRKAEDKNFFMLHYHEYFEVVR